MMGRMIAEEGVWQCLGSKRKRAGEERVTSGLEAHGVRPIFRSIHGTADVAATIYNLERMIISNRNVRICVHMLINI